MLSCLFVFTFISDAISSLEITCEFHEVLKVDNTLVKLAVT